MRWGNCIAEGDLKIKSVKPISFPAKCFIVKLNSKRQSIHLFKRLWYVLFPWLGESAQRRALWSVIISILSRKVNSFSVLPPKQKPEDPIHLWSFYFCADLNTLKQKRPFSSLYHGVVPEKRQIRFGMRLILLSYFAWRQNVYFQ